MSEALKRDFYAACPVWYWPVLWWQFVFMERHLTKLYAARGRADMTYGLALGPRGQLRLIFVSDDARRSAAPWQGRIAPFTLACTYVQMHPSPDGRTRSFSLSCPQVPMRPALTLSPVYLDPG